MSTKIVPENWRTRPDSILTREVCFRHWTQARTTCRVVGRLLWSPQLAMIKSYQFDSNKSSTLGELKILMGRSEACVLNNPDDLLFQPFHTGYVEQKTIIPSPTVARNICRNHSMEPDIKWIRFGLYIVVQGCRGSSMSKANSMEE